MKRLELRHLTLIALLLLTIALGGRGITDESSVMLSGDMARYVMNGVFIYDVIAEGGAWNWEQVALLAEHYYARYPALSLGHHPPLISVMLVPSFAVFGVSMFAARLVALGFFLAGSWAMYGLTKRVFGWQAAQFATLFFVANVLVLRAGQYVLSEMPMLALVLLSLNALLAYCDSSERRHLALFVALAVASLYAKQLAILIVPVYGVILVQRLGWRSLLHRDVVVMTLIGVVLVAPLFVMTLWLSPANVQLASGSVARLATGARAVSTTEILSRIVGTHVSLPVLALATAGLLYQAYRRGAFIVPGVVWGAAVIGGTVILAGPRESARYAFGALPIYFIFAASLAQTKNATARLLWLVLLSAVGLWQLWLVRDVRPSGAHGYESAARYVVEHTAGPVVLFDTAVDTGYLVFFVRKHDPGGLVMLRADQLLAPKNFDHGVGWSGDPDPQVLYKALQEFGVNLIVVEERETGPAPLLMLHRELASGEFVERRRFPIGSRERSAEGRSLVVYEFRHPKPANLDADLDIGLRLSPRRIRLKLGDLVRHE